MHHVNVRRILLLASCGIDVDVPQRVLKGDVIIGQTHASDMNNDRKGAGDLVAKDDIEGSGCGSADDGFHATNMDSVVAGSGGESCSSDNDSVTCLSFNRADTVHSRRG